MGVMGRLGLIVDVKGERSSRCEMGEGIISFHRRSGRCVMRVRVDVDGRRSEDRSWRSDGDGGLEDD